MLRIGKRPGYKARLVLSSSTSSEFFLPRSPRPLLASVNLTENCQARCRICNYWQSAKDTPITTRRAISLVNEIAEQDFEYLRWIGGEPLLRDDLFEVLAHVPPGKFSKVILGTNGSLLGQVIDQINESCLTNITVSLDGLREVNQRLRGVDFDTVRDALRRIEGKRIKVASILTKYLAEDIEGLLDWCDDEGYDYDVVLPSGVLPYSSTEEIRRNLSKLWPSELEVAKILSSVRRRGLMTRSMADGVRTYMVKRAYPFRHCVVGFTEVRITANGDVYNPCFELGPVGNILRESLRDILAPERIRKSAMEMYRLNCSLCLIGWQTSRTFEHPWANLSYINKRVRSN